MKKGALRSESRLWWDNMLWFRQTRKEGWGHLLSRMSLKNKSKREGNERDGKAGETKHYLKTKTKNWE